MAGRGKVEKDLIGEPLQIVRLQRGTLMACILGRTPLIYNAVSEKAKRDLLAPKKKSKAEKESTMKHFPMEEFRASVYRTMPNDDGPTRLLFPATAFKAALCDVALDMPGAAKTEIGRLTYVTGDYVSIYGIPEIGMDIVKLQGFPPKPDVRTRAKLRQWACFVNIEFSYPRLTKKAMGDLLAAAGDLRGIGDWRQQKGKGSYGQFDLVNEDNPVFLNLIQHAGREAQDAALLHPKPWDQQTLDLLAWYDAEVKDRGRKDDQNEGVFVPANGTAEELPKKKRGRPRKMEV